MQLYERYIQTIYPERKVYHESKCFMIYDVNEKNQMSIYDCYSESPQAFINILRFIEMLSPDSLWLKVQINTDQTEKNIRLYNKMGFKIWKTDAENVYMRVDFSEWELRVKAWFRPEHDSVKVQLL